VISAVPARALLLLLALALPAAAQDADRVGTHAQPVPSVAATPTSEPIRVDGVLSEEVWRSAPPATGFRQQEPEEGAPASQRTEVRFAYDAEALYIGARMYDELGAEGVHTRLVRRDSDDLGDHILFVFDTYHDHVGRTMLGVNPSGVRFDAGQASSYADPSWDPVWEVATRIDSLGWTAEIRIPWSQLRFPARERQTWGMQIWRYTERINERSMWSFWGLQEPGGPAFFGHLEELGVPPRRLGLELLPYVVGELARVAPRQPGSPLETGRDAGLRAGGDLKALVGSSVTVDATFNPDFGQVEVDPAVVNLTVFETFFEERRPFFVEGSGLFGFGGLNCYFCSNVQGLGLFYSRRIGRAPQGFVSAPAEFTVLPASTTILGAAKVTARTAGGLQVGVLNALTGAAFADAVTVEGTHFREEVEPLSNYFVGRVRRTYREGNLTAGVIGTSVLRRFQSDPLETLLPARAEAVGADWTLFWGQRRYNFMGSVALSQVSGGSAALLRLQHAPARYYQRPDRGDRSGGLLTDAYDPSLTALRGVAGYGRVAKVSGAWLWEAATNIRTPGFEVNDLAFLTRSDYVWVNANVFRNWSTPTSWYRYLNVIAGGQQQYNFDGDRTDLDVHAFLGLQTPRYWQASTFVILWPELLDDRLTRGGPVVRRAGSWLWVGNLSSDSRRLLALSGNARLTGNAEGALSYQAGVSARYRAAPNVTLSLGPSYAHNESTTQFVRRFNDPAATHFHGQRVVFAGLAQRTLSMELRMSAAFSPSLTLDLFMQPLISAGNYDNFKEYAGTRTTAKRVYDESQIEAIPSASGRDSAYVLRPDGEGGAAFQFVNPDFNFRSLRGNAVLRWEWRPGSTLFLVWQQRRAAPDPFGDFRLGRDIGALLESRADHVLLVKATYWVGR
jgi:hypothetical protein